MKKTLSAGVVLFNPSGEILLCHATETRHWDIPKGMGDPGELPIQAALRELREETSIVLMPERLVDLGRFDYRSDKTLHLFGVRVGEGEIDPAACLCTSMFPSRRDGRSIPEMDDFAWIAVPKVPDYVSGSLARLFEQALPLTALFDRLPTALA